MSADTNLALVRDAFAAWADGTGTFYDLVHPDAVWRIPGSLPHCGEWHGREHFMAEMVRPFLGAFSAFRLSVRQAWSDADTVVVHWTSDAIERDGRPYSNEYIYVIRMADDQAVEVTAFLDMAAFNATWDRNASAAEQSPAASTVN